MYCFNWVSLILAWTGLCGVFGLSEHEHPILSRYRQPSNFRPPMTNFNVDDPRNGPPSLVIHPNRDQPYVITADRLRQIRNNLMYWYFDKDEKGGYGDYQTNIHPSSPQLHKNLNFQLPFFGFRFNYTRVSINGYLEFSDPPDQLSYPLKFPTPEWPKRNDPSFIGIFYSKCRIGSLRDDDYDRRKPGVYFRMERDLRSRTDQFGVEVRERLKWDLRDGVVGADYFDPKHAVIITWKNVSFAGGIDTAKYTTNTFQLVLATDEVITYAMFNYLNIKWTSHTEAGGDTTLGEGGVPAFVGFNAGNGTRSYEYRPFSQMSTIRDLVGRGWANGFPGRHIFRIDEQILVGTCNKDIAGATLPLMFAPESGNMLGGTIVNITGPCFTPDMKIKCRFDVESVTGTVVDKNRAICVQPFVMADGYVIFDISIDGGKYIWKGKYFIESPATATRKIFFEDKPGYSIHETYPKEVKFTWNQYNLTSNLAAQVQISIWGYRERTIRPELVYIDQLETGVPNNGKYTIIPSSYKTRNNKGKLDLGWGFIQMNLTNPIYMNGTSFNPVIWSTPIPLGWYFAPQWQNAYGGKWADRLCDNWLKNDRFLKNFAQNLAQCPCTLEQAFADKGRFFADYDCDIDANPDCFYHKGARHCVKTGAPSSDGSEQQCCYDKNNYLMMSYDQMWGSTPKRSSNFGLLPWNEANKVPTLSQWFHDMVPFYYCCYWQEEQSVGCETFRFERRPTQDCVAYQSPYIATVFGDPHFITFDDVEYTFNGMGEFVLVRSIQDKYELNIQGRYERVQPNQYGPVAATKLTSIAAQDNSSTTVEVRMRHPYAQWRYKLDVFADGKRIYFDRPALRVQHFRGVTVYMPSYVLNQSEIIIMFQSGIGVEVVENKGYMASRVYLPWNYINKTRGLLGNWSFNQFDDFVLPNGQIANINTKDSDSMRQIYYNFGMHWALDDKDDKTKGRPLFLAEYGRSASYYLNRTFQPEFRKSPQEIIPPNRTKYLQIAEDLCGDSYQCKYDYAVSLNKELALITLKFFSDFTNLKITAKSRVLSCGILETPRFGRKSNFFFVPGTKIVFECNQDFVLVGDQRRTCTAQGKWDYPGEGYTECLRHVEYDSRQLGKTGLIILGAMLPLVLILVCCFVHLRRKYMKENMEYLKGDNSKGRKDFGGSFLKRRSTYVPAADNDGMLTEAPSHSVPNLTVPDYTPPPPPIHLSRSVPDLDAKQAKKKRLYDGTYSTGEPLPDAPRFDGFEDKDWDMDRDVDPGSLHSLVAPMTYSRVPTMEKQSDSLQTDIY